MSGDNGMTMGGGVNWDGLRDSFCVIMCGWGMVLWDGRDIQGSEEGRNVDRWMDSVDVRRLRVLHGSIELFEAQPGPRSAQWAREE